MAMFLPSNRAPDLLARACAVLYHCARVLLLRWPNYSFDDLAGLQDNLDGPAFTRAAAQMSADREGQRLLRDRALLTVRDADWDHFSRLPIESFGYNVWHHFYVNDLLEDIELQPSRLRWDADTEYAKARYRSSHDMRHVMLGLGVELHEEVSLQAFQFAQLPQKLSALVVVLGAVKLLFVDRSWWRFFAWAPRAWRAGKRGRPLHCVRFEDLWERPLDELRERYAITPIGSRYPVARRHPDADHFHFSAAPEGTSTP
ncbi:Coq4 family protein [Enhygromyxa salina]|uniref:Coenzyme Q (Ubiquinone) biosynthesis protein Coq4 n=1 Tax=Enhygromyxa salina TaxID=215803 RepID=A0A2S9YMC4_9BACT|nr:Coq4 family protein [Enhygromyxa salina]PRQ06251.1 Coenzyme Q (ubiquinone) biosynthesis protein Coq4 [Enhygromyxa salina]